MIDAESSYEGRYAQPTRTSASSAAGSARVSRPGWPASPTSTTTRRCPYSVFLGPGGAQFNLPQVYWKTIGVSVGSAYKHTFIFNRVYGDPIDPLGQTYANPPIRQIQRFRRMAVSYGLDGVSWWDWQETGRKEWRALGKRIDAGVSGRGPAQELPDASKGSRGDLVVWAQEHLKGAGESLRVTGVYNRKTARAVKSFQRSKKLGVDGKLDARTWRRLLDEKPKMVNWSRRSRSKAGADGERAALRVAAGGSRRDPFARRPLGRTRRTGYDRAGASVVARIEDYSPGHLTC